MPAELCFPAMGTWAHVVAVAPPLGAMDRARQRVEELEARWSRFRSDSEVSRLNRAGGRPVLVSADTVTLVRLALSGRAATGGRFNPAVLGALVAAGYDRSFDRLDGSAPEPAGWPSERVRPIAVNVDFATVTLPAGTGFDPGGIGKGLAADLVVAGLRAEGAEGACVNLGGDLRAEGTAPGGGPWVVDVAHPLGNGRPPLARLAFDAAGAATSSPLRRRWVIGEEARHHLIDSVTGRPACTDVAAVTVVTGDAWRAEVLAKAAVLAGAAEAMGVLKESGATGLIVDTRGRVHRAASLAPFLS